MSHIDELLNLLGFYSTLDLPKGYWHILLTPLSYEKTPFSTEDCSDCSLPKTKREGSFWGYRFVPASLKRECQIWSSGAVPTGFHSSKTAVCSRPLIHSTDFSVLFVLQTDMLDIELGECWPRGRGAPNDIHQP